RLAPSSRRFVPRASVRSLMRSIERSNEVAVVVDDERRMIGKAPVRVDRSGVRLGGDAGSRDLVVDPPADVVRPRVAAVGPKGVAIGTRVDAPEHVDETQFVEYAGEPRALFGQEPGILLVAAPVLQVDLAVRNVP